MPPRQVGYLWCFCTGLALSQMRNQSFCTKIWNHLDLFFGSWGCVHSNISRFVQKNCWITSIILEMLLTWLHPGWGWKIKKNSLTTSAVAGVELLFLRSGGEVGYISIFIPFDPNCSVDNYKIMQKSIWIWGLFLKNEILLNSLEHKQNTWVGAITPVILTEIYQF